MRRFLVLALLFLPVFALAQSLNAGFVQGLWYSQSPFFAGDDVRIYTAIQNNSGFDIQGTVEFLVNEKAIGESFFSALQGRIVETWADWKVSQGTHAVSARVKQAFKVEIGKEPEPISLQNASLGASQVFADQDTDQDGIGNIEDEDDDNDGLSDTEEQARGTNPLARDSNRHEPEKAEKEAAQEQAPQQEFVEKIREEYIPLVEETGNSLAQAAGERLHKKRAELQEKKQAFETGASQEPLSASEQGLDFLLAAAITALPQWQLGVFLSFAVILALALRRFKKEPPTGG